MPLFVIFKVFETLLILFAFLMLALIPIILIGVVYFVLKRNHKSRVAWQDVARKLNFTMPNPKQLEMFGIYNGCEIKASIRAEHVSSSESNRKKYYTYCTAAFPQNLRFLLDINSPKGYLSGSNNIQLGQPNFDNKFSAKCYDANVLRNLLLSDFPSDKTKNLLGDLMLANQYGGTIKIDDNKVFIEKSGFITDESILLQMIEITAFLCKRFSEARKNFPLADWEKQLIYNWQELANGNNLAFDKNNFKLQGNYKNFPILVELKTDKGKWQTSIKLDFPRSLMVGLKLMPENSIHKALSWIGVQDIKVGNKEFDDAFIVKGKNVQMAKHLLQPDVCNQLVALNKNASALLIDDTTIAFTYDTILGDKNQLKSNIEGMLSTANKLLS